LRRLEPPPQPREARRAARAAVPLELHGELEAGSVGPRRALLGHDVAVDHGDDVLPERLLEAYGRAGLLALALELGPGRGPAGADLQDELAPLERLVEEEGLVAERAAHGAVGLVAHR